jgi:hypothetical protein
MQQVERQLIESTLRRGRTAGESCAALLWHSPLVHSPAWPHDWEDAAGISLAGPRGVHGNRGDSVSTAPRTSTSPAREKKPLAQDPLPEPRPGQARPDK